MKRPTIVSNVFAPPMQADKRTARSYAETDALLEAVRAGDMAARNELVEKILPELKRLARGLMAGERSNHTLGASGTGLVNILWLRMLAPRLPGDLGIPREDLGCVKNTQHLLAIAVRNMRRILVDYSRMAKARKRPNRNDRVELESLARLGEEMASLNADALDVHEALQRLEPLQPQSAKAIELRYFAGLTNEEAAAAMGIPVIHFRRRCESGLRWLRVELQPGNTSYELFR
jgi:RNA polymerase sigma-70 factor (ECF subfamily)